MLHPGYVAGGLVLAAAALLYLLTLDNGLQPEELRGGDLITHQYAQVEGRPGNAPGYPLYTMGGWLWYRLGRAALGWAFNPIEILSLYSTLWALASLLVLYLVLLRATRSWWPVAVLLTAFYASTYFFWYYSVTTEQYTSAVFQTLLVLWLAFKWDDRPRQTLVLWLAFLGGTMLANMVTTLMIIPPLLWFILFKSTTPGGRDFFLYRYLKQPGLMLAAAGAALLPLLSYAYVYIRGAQHPEWRGAGDWPSTWTWFIQFLTIQQGRDELGPGLRLAPFFTGEFPALMWQELTWPVFWGGLLGLAFLGKHRAIFLYSTLLLYFAFCWAYRFGNWYQVIIPAYPIFVVGFAAGLRAAWEYANRQIVRTNFTDRPGPRFYLSGAFAILLLAGLLLYRFSFSLPTANQQNRPGDTGLDPGWAILADQPARPAVVLAGFEERLALQYLHIIWGAAPLLYPAGVDDPPPAAAVEPYITRQAAATAPAATLVNAHPQAAGEQLIRLAPAPRSQLPAGAVPVSLPFGQGLNLAGWEIVEPGRMVPADVAARLERANWQLALYWQAGQPLMVDYTISVRPQQNGQLIMSGGEAVIQDHQPVWGFYPTSRWLPGEIVRDVYALSLPAGLIPDGFQVVVYQTTETGLKNLAEQVIEVTATHAP